MAISAGEWLSYLQRKEANHMYVLFSGLHVVIVKTAKYFQSLDYN